MNEGEKYVLSKTLTFEKGEVLTVTVTMENTSPKMKMVQDCLYVLFNKILSDLKS